MATRTRRRKSEEGTEVPVKTAGTIKVFRAYSASGALMDEDEGLEEMDARNFDVEPAYVSVNHGRTVNIGNYESVRVDVRVSLPCYAEEVGEALLHADNTAINYLEDVVKDYVEELK